MAKDALELHLYGMEADGDSISEPTSLKRLRFQKEALSSWFRSGCHLSGMRWQIKQ